MQRTSKVTTVEIEDNFARSSQMRSYLHGAVQDASTTACKHVLAEVRAAHSSSYERVHGHRGRNHKASDPEAILDAAAGAPVCYGPGPGPSHQLVRAGDVDIHQESPACRTTWNGWSLFLKEAYANQNTDSALSANERRIQTFQRAHDDWQNMPLEGKRCLTGYIRVTESGDSSG